MALCGGQRVSTGASECALALGQITGDARSHEIVSLPALIRRSQRVGWLVTLEVMGCQKAIARGILEKPGNSRLGRKQNPPALSQPGATEDPPFAPSRR